MRASVSSACALRSASASGARRRGLGLAGLGVLLLGEQRRLLGRLQGLGELGGLLGAALVLVVLDAARRGGAARSRCDPRVFGLEPREAPAFLGRAGAERVAARVEVGRGGLRLGRARPRRRRAHAPASSSRARASAARSPAPSSASASVASSSASRSSTDAASAISASSRSRSRANWATRRSSSARALAARFSSASSASRASAMRWSAAARRASSSRNPGSSAAASACWRAASACARRALGDVEQVGVELPRGLGEGGLGLAPGDQVGERLVPADVGGEVAVAARLARLAPQALDLDVDLLQHVLDAQQIVLGPLEAQLRLVAARVQAGDAGRLLEDQPARLGLGGDDLADLALADEGGRARAGRGVGEQELHVAGAHLAAVDPIGRARLALDAAGDLDRLVLVEGGGRAAVGVVEQDADLGVVARRALAGAGEDHVVHARGAHGLERAFAHHPAQRLDEVRLAAAVRADDAGEAGLDLELCGVAEALEAGEAQALEFHPTALSSGAGGPSSAAARARGEGPSLASARERAEGRARAPPIHP